MISDDRIVAALRDFNKASKGISRIAVAAEKTADSLARLAAAFELVPDNQPPPPAAVHVEND